jgi:hypothetical protein
LNTYELIQEIIKKLKRNFLWVIFFTALGALIMGYIAKQEKTIFTSYSKIFPLIQDGSSDPLSSIKSQLGFDVGGSSDMAKYYNVAELVKSKSISRKIVSYSTSAADPTPLYLSLLKDHNNTLGFNKDKIVLSKDSLENLYTAASLLQDKINIVKEKTEFTSIFVNAGNGQLALRLNDVVLDCLSEFYINSRTEKARIDLMQVKNLKDSLLKELDLVERAIAGFGDTRRYLVEDAPSAPLIKMERIREEILEQYKNTATAYQTATFKLMSEKPIFQILDKPSGPVPSSIVSWKRKALVGGLIGFIIGLILALRKLITDLIIKSLKEA